ncbi:hypothetical protein TIFTF001_024750 [Ficus carica]|uniref:Myb/SANT-like domain-containing protein n=1 Tax=Ficus carica TaxID=3494 RepID=A0AA88AYA0_FICCA|nr:hypothetical protein TIFTF001_024750 [Ficus carica]
MKKIYRGWKALQVRTGLGYDPSTNRVICSDDAWQSFIQVHKECSHLRHKELRNKELYYNVSKKNHIVGTSGFKSVTMRDSSTPYVEPEFSMDNSGTHPVLKEELTPTNGRQQGNTRRVGDDAGPSRSRGSSEMGIPLDHRTIMWHYFEAHLRVQRTLHQLPDDDRRGSIASVVKSQSPPAD